MKTQSNEKKAIRHAKRNFKNLSINEQNEYAQLHVKCAESNRAALDSLINKTDQPLFDRSIIKRMNELKRKNDLLS